MAKANGNNKTDKGKKEVAEVVDISKGDTRATGTVIEQLAPGVIIWDEVTNVRPWEENGDEKEAGRISELAKDIKKEGQLQNIVVREVTNADGVIEYHGIAGRRRTKACALTGVKVNAMVLQGVDDDAAFRKSLSENYRRLQMSPMDMALNIAQIRTRNGWDEAPDYSAKIAKLLGVSRTYVTQKLKLLEDLNADQQKDLHAGIISEEAALALASKLKKETADTIKAETLERAKELAAKEQADKMAEQAAAAGTPMTEEEKAAAADPANLAPKGNEAPVQERHVTQAAREKDNLDKPEKLKWKEIVDMFEQLDGPAYGYEDSDVRKWARCTVDCFEGTGKMKTWKTLFNRMTESANEGTPPVETAPGTGVGDAGNGKKGKGTGTGNGGGTATAKSA